MKIRNGFVSNSSSSSFVVIDKDNDYVSLDTEDYIIGDRGVTEFGWTVKDIKEDIHSRINFVVLQAQELSSSNKEKADEWMKMIYETIYKYSKIKNITCIISNEYDCKKSEKWGYIDHQSCSCEGINIEMFESKKVLADFIFGKKSFIHTDNDNH